jgi:hypothetical protein
MEGSGRKGSGDDRPHMGARMSDATAPRAQSAKRQRTTFDETRARDRFARSGTTG